MMVEARHALAGSPQDPAAYQAAQAKHVAGHNVRCLKIWLKSN